MAESKQFGSPKILQFGDKTAGNQSGESGHCAQCEAMLADAIDGTLSAADQALFDGHMAECGPCAQMHADARRGVAWLELLRDPAPEPSAALLERILAQTVGARALPSAVAAEATLSAGATSVEPEGSAHGVSALSPAHGASSAYGRIIPFRSRVSAAMHRSPFGQIMLQPRLAMTAAMAFLSIALTMDLTGVHPLSLRASDLKPSSLRRDFSAAHVRVVQYYAGLRVVYELESRVRDLQSASDNDAPQGSSGTPAAQPDQTGPAKQDPSGKPEQRQGPSGSGPHSGPASSRPAPNSSTSRRESVRQELQMASLENGNSLVVRMHKNLEGGLA